jgi:hypothetical protein
MRKITKIIIVAVAIILVAGLIFWDVPRNRVGMFLERDAIEKTARAYLKAEMEGNSKQVYAFLAPSSTYKQTHSYEEFIKDIAGYPPMAINTYKIIRIYRLRDNDNRRNYPGVDKFVQVEVEVTFTHAGPDSIFNYSFTFLKEKRNWYKG